MCTPFNSEVTIRFYFKSELDAVEAIGIINTAHDFTDEIGISDYYMMTDDHMSVDFVIYRNKVSTALDWIKSKFRHEFDGFGYGGLY